MNFDPLRPQSASPKAALSLFMATQTLSQRGRTAFRHQPRGTAWPDDGSSQSTTMGVWTISTKYGQWQFGGEERNKQRGDAPPWANQPVGGGGVRTCFRPSYVTLPKVTERRG